MPTEKTGNYQSSLKGEGGGYPPIGKTPIYFRFFLMKASLRTTLKKVTKKRLLLQELVRTSSIYYKKVTSVKPFS